MHKYHLLQLSLCSSLLLFNAASFAAEALKPAVPAYPSKSEKSNGTQPAISGTNKPAPNLHQT